MEVLLRAAVLFGLGFGIGVLLLGGPRSKPEAVGAGPVGSGAPHAASQREEYGAPSRGPDWGRVVIRASTGGPLEFPSDASESTAPAAGSRDAQSAPSDATAPAGGAVDPLEPSARGSADDQADHAPGLQRDLPSTLPDAELEVRPGQTLSEIAFAAYGTANPGLVEALARYNGLGDPDDLRVGTTLRLPERKALGL